MSRCKKMKADGQTAIQQALAGKAFVIQPHQPCGGGGGGSAPKNPKVDLVIIIDTSGSMRPRMVTLSNAASTAVAAAAETCGPDLEIAWFGLQGVDPNTQFKQTLRDYLIGRGVPTGYIKHQTSEDGADAVSDVAMFYPWREGACRAILYLSDEALERGDPQNAQDILANDQAIAVAQSHQVTVFTYFARPANDATSQAMLDEYKRLSLSTNGQTYVHPQDQAGFARLLEEVICNGCGIVRCKSIKWPEVAPCFRLHWGDGPSDQLETHDTEVLILEICNNYDNLAFQGMSLPVIKLVQADGSPVPTLPDGSPAAMIVPTQALCLGNLEPCSCIYLELVLIARNAAPGQYKIELSYCIDNIAIGGSEQTGDNGFTIDLVMS